MHRYGRPRGGIRGGRGGPVRMMMPLPPPPPPMIHHPHPPPPPNQPTSEMPFDVTFAPDIFPRTTPEPDDAALTAALLKRNTEVTPGAEEMQAIQSLVTRVQNIIENIILSPGAFTACQVDEIRQVGSFKQGTILAGHRTADFVVILKTFPTKECVEALHVKVSEDLKLTECVRSNVTPHGFDLSNVQATVRILITTIAPNMRKLDPAIHMDGKVMNEHWQAIKHSRWVEENANSSTIKVLVRILRDIRNRYEAFKPLLPLKLDLLAHFAVTNTVNLQPLTLGAAFRRTISLMSTGLFLPTYAGTSMRGVPLTAGQSDKITTAAQTLMLVLAHGGYAAVLGLEKRDVLNTATILGSVIIHPCQKVFESDDEEGARDIEMEEDSEGSPAAVA